MEMCRIRRRAGEILSERGNRLLLIEALAISLVFIMLYSLMSYACAAVLFFAPGSDTLMLGVIIAHAAFTVLLTFLFTAPTLLGLFHIAQKMVAGEDAVLADLFFAFSDRHTYARALAVVRELLLCGACVWFVCELTYLFFVYFLPPTLLCAVWCGFLIGVEVLLGAVLLLHTYPNFYGALRYSDVPLSEARARGRACVPYPISRGRRFFVSFLPYLLLGALTVGILWIADTLPRMLIAYFVDCENE